MGDAKKRGTFEQRQSESVAREQERVRSLPPRRRVNPKSAAFMAGIAGIVASSNSRVMDAAFAEIFPKQQEPTK